MTRPRAIVARLLVGICLCGLVVLLVSASLKPSRAQAVDVCVAHPSDASVVCVRNNDSTVDACDRDADGHRAYARVITAASQPGFLSPYYDDNDSQPGCANITFPSRVLGVAVCVQFEGCSAFKSTAPPAVPPPAAPPPPAPPAPPAPSASASRAEPVVYAAGDISCNGPQRAAADPTTCQSAATARKIIESERARGNPGFPAAVLALGDIQYQDGSLPDFQQFYNRDWGFLRPVTFPVLGNHEYHTPRALGYWEFFDRSRTNRFGERDKGWYAFDVGSWRLYAINSNCARQRRVCARGAEQHRWLRRDMAANPRSCSLMFMHHPYWDSSYDNFDTPQLRPLIEEFWGRGGDVVLAGHAHQYERFGRSDPAQRLVFKNTRRFRLFIVGTGGKTLRRSGRKEPNSRVTDNTDHGVLQLRLGNGNYGWRFVSAVSTDRAANNDRGAEGCHRATR